MPRRNRKQVEEDTRKTLEDIRIGINGATIFFEDLSNKELYKYERALKEAIKILKPFVLF